MYIFRINVRISRDQIFCDLSQDKNKTTANIRSHYDLSITTYIFALPVRFPPPAPGVTAVAAVVPAVVTAAAVAAVVPAVGLREHSLSELDILRDLHSLLVLDMIDSDLCLTHKLEAGIGFLHICFHKIHLDVVCLAWHGSPV